jgi:hypothetical protein
MSWVWVEACQIEKGEIICPIVLESDDAKEYADCAAITGDLTYARFCFSRARNLGAEIPAAVEDKTEDERTEIRRKKQVYRAFVNAGLMSYARAFDMGRRRIKLRPDEFSHWSDQTRKLHDHLYALRQKHVAHSVNEYEYCEPIGMIVLNSAGQRKAGLLGLGIVSLIAVGMPDGALKAAIEMIDDLRTRMGERMNAVGRRVRDSLKQHLDNGGSWQMAPIAHIPDPQNAGKPRKY